MELATALADHWLFALNSLNGIILLGTFLSPLLMVLGLTGLGSMVFVPYRALCLQRPDHSFFIFGYQMAMEQRMVAIYGALFAAGMVYAQLGARWHPLPLWAYMLLSLPMAADVITQSLGLRASTWYWRILTGGIFGVATVAFLYPRLADVISGSRATAPTFTKKAPASSVRSPRG